ncbi:hypothetical protein [Pelagibacterium lentulum]|nr:hypothetical protein [Pelagibacterium lentulum]
MTRFEKRPGVMIAAYGLAICGLIGGIVSVVIAIAGLFGGG